MVHGSRTKYVTLMLLFTRVGSARFVRVTPICFELLGMTSMSCACIQHQKAPLQQPAAGGESLIVIIVEGSGSAGL